MKHLKSTGQQSQSKASDILKRHDNYLGQFGQWQVNSHFQAIYSTAQQRVIGYEGLLRASADGVQQSPLAAFSSCRDSIEKSQLDRLSRTLHLLNFKSVQRQGYWLFINICCEEIHPNNLCTDNLVNLLAEHGYQPQQIVIEILEDAIHDECLLAEFIYVYKQAGFIIAIDDFGAGHSNFDRIWRVSPNIVKLDSCMVKTAVTDKRVRRIFSRLVKLLRETECLVLIEGVETEDEAMLAMDTEADMVQGFFYSLPALLTEQVPGCESFELVSQKLALKKAKESNSYGERVEVFKALLLQCAKKIQLGQLFKQSCVDLLSQYACGQMYLINDSGQQVTETLAGEHLRVNRHYQPFSCGRGANWGRRGYFTTAIASLGEVHISAPYLALPGGTMSVTFSLAFNCQGQILVSCCDFDLHFLEAATDLPLATRQLIS